MSEVGVKELKSHLSEYLRGAVEGRSVVVTDRGRPIARIVPFVASDEQPESPLDEMIRDGRATRPVMRRPRPQPMQLGVTISDLVAEQRGPLE